MTRFTWIAVLATAVWLAAGAPAQAATVYQESTQGDLSNSGLAPTAISVAPGVNGIAGGAANPDRDYAAFTVPAGYGLESLYVRAGTVTAGLQGSFIGLQAGSQVTVDPDGASAAGLLGWTLFSAADVDQDILARMGTAGAGAAGFTAPLGAGTYSLWLQELGGRSSYVLDLELVPVPVPAAWSLLLGGLAMLVARARKRGT
jgi:hypothetical protein